MEWITVNDVLGIGGLPNHPYNVRKKLDSWATTETKRSRQGAKGYEYHISILPPITQAALLKRAGKIQIGEQVFDIPQTRSVKYCREALWEKWNRAGTHLQEKAKTQLTAVQACVELIQNGVRKMDAYNTIVEQFGITHSTLRRCLNRTHQIEPCDWLPALLSGYRDGAQKARAGRFAYIDPQAWAFIKADYLRPEEPTLTKCYERLVHAAQANGWKIPGYNSIRRRIEFEIKPEQRVMLRKGEHALMSMYPPQERTVLDLHAMQWINGDGYLHNVKVRWFNGQEIRPKTWFWQDIYSRKIIGWRTDISENTDSIRLSMMDVFAKYGIPEEITIDNTRAAANKWITGGVANRYRFKVQKDEPLGIIPMLGIKLHWSSVILGHGHGQAKPIERAFGVGGLDEYIDKHPLCAGGYTGPNPMAKPDNYGERAVPVEDFLQAIEEGVEMYNNAVNRRTEVCQGYMSFNQAFDASYISNEIRKATPEQLQIMMLATEAVRVSNHGTITLNAGGSIAARKNRYYNQRMMDHMGEKVVARFDPQHLHESIEIYTLNGIHICTADCLEKEGFGDTQAGREHKRLRTQYVKAHKQAALAQKAMTILEVAEHMPAPDNHEPPEARIVRPVRPAQTYGNAAIAHQPEAFSEEEETRRQRIYEQNLDRLIQEKKNRI